MLRRPTSSPDPAAACASCSLARRDFVQGGAAAVAGILAALGVSPARAAALPVRLVRALAVRDQELTYPVPAEDGAQIDHGNQVIVVRWTMKAYAFNLACPHQNTALRWQPEDRQFQCPKHHSRYQPDGVFVSGRATRGMDRFAVRLSGTNLVVDVDKMIRQDRDQAGWDAAMVSLPA